MRTPPFISVLVLTAAALLAGCRGPAPTQTTATVYVHPWPLPVETHSAQPNLSRGTAGSALLSWLEPTASGHQLRYARWENQRWTPARTIAAGADWFVNWADTPHLIQANDGALWAQWLRKSASTPYAYDVLLARSADVQAWSAPITVHDDGTASEHGFVSLWPDGKDGLGIAWLDGRHTGAATGHDHGAGHGAMSLRSAHLNAHLHKLDDQQLDAMTCDCCQTAAAVAHSGPVLVYRGRTSGEIRDIHFTAYRNGSWRSPRSVHDDQWMMPACPVNGPALAVSNKQIWVAWYTAAGGTPSLRISSSADDGKSFAPAYELDRGSPVQGRVQLAADDNGGVWVSWLKEESQRQSLWLARIGTPVVLATKVADLHGRGRATGVPQMLAHGDGVALVWTDVINGEPRLQGATATPTP